MASVVVNIPPLQKVLLDPAIDALYRAMKPPCTECGCDKYTRFRYFNNKTAMLERAAAGQPMNPQGRFACRSPLCLAANPGKTEVEFTHNGKKRPRPYNTKRCRDAPNTNHKRKAPQDDVNSPITKKKKQRAEMPYAWQQQQQQEVVYSDHYNNIDNGNSNLHTIQMQGAAPASSNYYYYNNYGVHDQTYQQQFLVPHVVMGFPALHMAPTTAEAAAGNCYNGYPIMAMDPNNANIIYYNNYVDAAAAANTTSCQQMEPPMPPLVDVYYNDPAAHQYYCTTGHDNDATFINNTSTMFMDPLHPAAFNGYEEEDATAAAFNGYEEYVVVEEEQQQEQQQSDVTAAAVDGVKLPMPAELLRDYDDDSTVVVRDEDPAPTCAEAEEAAAALAALIDVDSNAYGQELAATIFMDPLDPAVNDDAYGQELAATILMDPLDPAVDDDVQQQQQQQSMMAFLLQEEEQQQQQVDLFDFAELLEDIL